MRHPDLEFQVQADSPHSDYYKTWSEACEAAVRTSASREVPVYIDVLTWSRAGARAWGGDDAAERYSEDPEASVFERFVIRVESQGRIP